MVVFMGTFSTLGVIRVSVCCDKSAFAYCDGGWMEPECGINCISETLFQKPNRMTFIASPMSCVCISYCLLCPVEWFSVWGSFWDCRNGFRSQEQPALGVGRRGLGTGATSDRTGHYAGLSCRRLTWWHRHSKKQAACSEKQEFLQVLFLNWYHSHTPK